MNSDNRSRQCDPEHKSSGPGRPAAYQGDRSQANLDNHSNQLNPNNQNYQQKK
jgi:hypothetical protein